MSNELWQAFVQITGAANALLLGLVLILSPRLHRTRARRKLGLALLAYGYLLVTFTAVDNLWIPTTWWILLSDYVIVLFTAALFLDYVHSSLGRGSISRMFYLPPVLYFTAALILGTDFIFGAALNVVIICQVTYSSITTWIYVRSVRRLVNRVHHLRMLIAGLWILHLFQLSRMLLPEVGWMFDIVPLAGAVLILTFTVLVLTDSRSLLALSQVASERPTTSLTLDAIDAYMHAEQPHLDAKLTQAQLSEALGMTQRELAQLVGASDDGNFYSFVNRHRVREARDLLSSPTEARTSVEAIGLMSGFRSRSTFYEAFRKDTGVTPAQYRKEQLRARR